MFGLSGCSSWREILRRPERSEETTKSSQTTQKETSTKSSSPATGSEASVDDVVVYNETNEKRHVELVVTPIDDSSNRFTEDFTLGPYARDSYADSKTIPDVEQMDEECRVEVTVDGERTATYEWDGDVNDYTGLEIYVDYEEISFTRKVA